MPLKAVVVVGVYYGRKRVTKGVRKRLFAKHNCSFLRDAVLVGGWVSWPIAEEEGAFVGMMRFWP
jgi:hypothetical protein